MNSGINFLEVLDRGIKMHSAGDFDRAEVLYREILCVDPRNADAHNLLADLHHRKFEHLKALYHANQAVAISRNAQFLNTRGSVFIGMGRLQEAMADLRSATKLAPGMAEAYCNLSNVCRSLKEFNKAVEYGAKAVELNPELASGWVNLGAAQQDIGLMQEALHCYQKAVALDAKNGLALSNLGKVQYQLHDFIGAIESFEAATSLGLDSLEQRFAYAHSLQQLNRPGDAGKVLEDGFSVIRDRSALSWILRQDPFFGVLYNACTYYYHVVGASHRAVGLYEACLGHRETDAAIWLNMGTIYFDIHRLDDAIRCYKKALEIAPSLAWAHSNIGVCYSSQKNSPEAIQNFKNALAVQQDFAPALGWLLREKTEICDWSEFSDVRARVRGLCGTTNTHPISPFVALSVFDDPGEVHYWAQLSANALFSAVSKNAVPCRLKPRGRRKKVRVGYYSFDFRHHPVAHLTARLFELHDKARFDVYAYSYGPDDGSEVRQRIQSAVKHFVDVKDLSVVDTAARIAEDDLDILIDLTGNTLHTRSHVMALRPARIQAHWLGFIGSMGSKYYDYILADDIVAPVGEEAYFSENILRLPFGMHVMDETRVIDGSRQTRAANNLPELGVVFGCFCQSFKIQPEMFARWMEILRGVPGSVLWLASGPSGMEENLRAEAERQGIDPSRLVIAQRCDIPEYLSRFALIDLFLDTYPYTSGTVASDALLAGCPVLTLSGRTMVSRMAGSILRHAALGDMVCGTPEGYVELGTRLGNSPSSLGALRARVLEARATASLFNMPQAVRGLEDQLVGVVESRKPGRK